MSQILDALQTKGKSAHVWPGSPITVTSLGASYLGRPRHGGSPP